MDEERCNREFKKILYQLKGHGINQNLYNKIAEEFNCFIHLPTNYLLEVLSYFVAYKGKPIYVNEIRNYLKDHSNELFIKYGNAFHGYAGCLEVFGIKQENVQLPSFKVEVKQEDKKIKEYDDYNIKKRRDRTVKRDAKKISAEKFKSNLIRRKEKDEKNEEIRRLIRKQDI